MPPKSKRQRALEEAAKRAREGAKKLRIEQASDDLNAGPSSLSQQPTIVDPSTAGLSSLSLQPPIVDLSTRERSVTTRADSEMSEDPTFDPEKAVEEDGLLKMEQFVEEWSISLDHDDKVSLGLFLCFHLEQLRGLSKTMAAEYIGIMMGKSERTIRQWKANFIENGYEVPESKQGRYQRSGILWSSEELNRKATKHVHENANVRGQPNLTASIFCQWVNESLLPNSNLEPGFPRRISVETARQWLHHLGFETLSPSKGMYFDGHERDDVIAYRKTFLREMVELGFLHPDQAPTPEAAAAFPTDIPLPSTETRNKTVVFFHDESTFLANDDQRWQWGKKGEFMIRPKSKGSGIMVSDFVDERNGYLQLTDEEFERARSADPTNHQAESPCST